MVRSTGGPPRALFRGMANDAADAAEGAVGDVIIAIEHGEFLGSRVVGVAGRGIRTTGTSTTLAIARRNEHARVGMRCLHVLAQLVDGAPCSMEGRGAGQHSRGIGGKQGVQDRFEGKDERHRKSMVEVRKRVTGRRRKTMAHRGMELASSQIGKLTACQIGMLAADRERGQMSH